MLRSDRSGEGSDAIARRVDMLCRGRRSDEEMWLVKSHDKFYLLAYFHKSSRSSLNGNKKLFGTRDGNVGA